MEAAKDLATDEYISQIWNITMEYYSNKKGENSDTCYDKSDGL